MFHEIRATPAHHSHVRFNTLWYQLQRNNKIKMHFIIGKNESGKETEIAQRKKK